MWVPTSVGSPLDLLRFWIRDAGRFGAPLSGRPNLRRFNDHTGAREGRDRAPRGDVVRFRYRPRARDSLVLGDCGMNEEVRTIRRRRKRSPHIRFERKFTPVTESGCWLWLAASNLKGYGYFWFGEYGHAAHRAAWIIYRGPIPAGMHVLHKCDTPSCVNPNHLFLGTQQDNTDDMLRKGRAKCGENSPRGGAHPMAKLTAEMVVEMRRLYSSGVKRSELARMFSVSPCTSGRIVDRKLWAYI